MTIRELLNCLSEAARECGAPRVARKLCNAHEALRNGTLEPDERKELFSDLRETVLSTAKRIGKARFAQILSKHVDGAEAIPKYIKNAIEWLEL